MNNKESPIENIDAQEDTQETSVQKSYSVGNEMDTDQDRKLFIGYGVNQLITEEVLQEFFEQFGDIERIVIKRDVMTSKPRGFAFITMAKSEHLWKVLNACPLTINGRQIDVKLAKSQPISKKVFVGGIDPNLTKEDIIEVFSQFGKVVEVELPFDMLKRRRREFCFVIFETEEAANQASENPKRIIFDRECDVKKATPKPLAQQLKRNQQNMHHSFNSYGQSQNSNQYYGTSTNSSLNYSKNYSKPLYQSQNYARSGPSSYYRGGYKPKNSMNRNSHFNQNDRRSVDSQYNNIHEYNGGNASFNSRKNVNQHSSQNLQYLSNSVSNDTEGNNSSRSFNQQQYYEQLAQQSYYG